MKRSGLSTSKRKGPRKDLYELVELKGEQSLRLPREFWDRQDQWILKFPKTWKVRVCRMQGDALRPKTPKEIEERLRNPLGGKSLRDLAAGRKEAVIVVDDMTRPTRAENLVAYVVEELLEAGIGQDNIRFILSLGSHGAHGQDDFKKKLGGAIVENYRVYNHNCYENCVYAGETRRGIPLMVNREFMRCDLKIAIGAVLPHLYVGYSGGGKIVLPGLAHMDTIDKFHSSLLPDQKGNVGDLNPLCGDIEDAVRLVGLDFKIDVLVNTQGEVVDLYAGAPDEVYKQAIPVAQQIYQSELHRDQDIVVTNAHLKANEGDIAMLLGFKSLRKTGGICVLLMNAPKGQMTHYLMRSFGKYTGGRQWVTRSRLPEETELIVLSEYKDRTSFDSFDSQERIVWKSSWKDVLIHLKSRFPGRAKVAVYPDGTIQYV